MQTNLLPRQLGQISSNVHLNRAFENVGLGCVVKLSARSFRFLPFFPHFAHISLVSILDSARSHKKRKLIIFKTFCNIGKRIQLLKVKRKRKGNRYISQKVFKTASFTFRCFSNMSTAALATTVAGKKSMD